MTRLLRDYLFDVRYATHRFVLAWLLYLLILVLGSVPHARADIGLLAPGLVLHALAYGGLTCLLASGLRTGPWRNSVQAVLLIAIMGAGDECVQSFFPYRHAAVSDWVVDCLAGFVAATMMVYWYPWAAPRRR